MLLWRVANYSWPAINSWRTTTILKTKIIFMVFKPFLNHLRNYAKAPIKDAQLALLRVFKSDKKLLVDEVHFAHFLYHQFKNNEAALSRLSSYVYIA